MSFSIINTFNPFTHSVQAVNYAPNGLYVVAGGPSNDPAYVFEYNTGNIISQYSNFSSFCYDLRFSPDGDYVLGASQEVFIFEAATGNEYFWLDAGSVLSADWSPDGTKFAFPDNTNNLVRVYDFVTKTELFTLSQEKPDRVRFSPDGNYLAVGSDRNTTDMIKIWDLNTKTVLTNFQGHLAGEYDVEFVDWSPDGTKIVSGTDNNDNDVGGDILVWEFDTGNIVSSFTELTGLGFSRSCKWSPDGLHIGVTSWIDDIIYLWDWQADDIIFTFTGHSCRIFNVDFDPNRSYLQGYRLASCDEYSCCSVKVWQYDVNPPTVNTLAATDIVEQVA